MRDQALIECNYQELHNKNSFRGGGRPHKCGPQSCVLSILIFIAILCYDPCLCVVLEKVAPSLALDA